QRRASHAAASNGASSGSAMISVHDSSSCMASSGATSWPWGLPAGAIGDIPTLAPSRFTVDSGGAPGDGSRGLGMKYSADLTAGSLKVSESRIVARLLIDGVDRQGWKVALCSGVLGRPLQPQLVILGTMSLGGNILAVENLAESLQVAFDSG